MSRRLAVLAGDRAIEPAGQPYIRLTASASRGVATALPEASRRKSVEHEDEPFPAPGRVVRFVILQLRVGKDLVFRLAPRKGRG